MLRVKVYVEDERRRSVFRYRATIPRIEDLTELLKKKLG